MTFNYQTRHLDSLKDFELLSVKKSVIKNSNKPFKETIFIETFGCKFNFSLTFATTVLTVSVFFTFIKNSLFSFFNWSENTKSAM